MGKKDKANFSIISTLPVLDYKALIFIRLLEFCEANGIKIELVNHFERQILGCLKYETGTFRCSRPVIQILNRKECVALPWVLAHEVGHFIAINTYNDNSEKGADTEAKRFCLSYCNIEDSILRYCFPLSY